MKRSVAMGWVATDVLSTFGDQLYKFALPWVILAATGSTWDLSLISTVQQGALLLFGLAIGVLMDRPRRLQWMILALVSEAISVGVISYFPMNKPVTLVAVYGLIFVIATMSQLYKTGVRAVLPLVVRDGRLEQANGLIQTARTAMQMVGPIAAGWLVLRMHRAPFVLDGLSFLMLAATLFAMQSAIRSRLPAAASRSSLWRDAREGIRYLRGDKVLFRFAIIMAMTNLGLTGTLAMVIYPIQREFHLHSTVGGLILAGAALASMVGSLVTARVVSRLGTMKALVASLILLGMGTAAMATSVLGVFFGGYALTLACAALFNVAMLSLQQRRTPAELRGRVTSTSLVLSRITAPIGAAGTGLIGSMSTVETALLVDASIVCGAALAAVWAVQSLRKTMNVAT